MVYMFGWGIEETPDDRVIEMLEELDCNSTVPQIQRAHWLIYVAGLTRADKANIIGTVMALTRVMNQ